MNGAWCTTVPAGWRVELSLAVVGGCCPLLGGRQDWAPELGARTGQRKVVALLLLPWHPRHGPRRRVASPSTSGVESACCRDAHATHPWPGDG